MPYKMLDSFMAKDAEVYLLTVYRYVASALLFFLAVSAVRQVISAICFCSKNRHKIINGLRNVVMAWVRNGAHSSSAQKLASKRIIERAVLMSRWGIWPAMVFLMSLLRHGLSQDNSEKVVSATVD